MSKTKVTFEYNDGQRVAKTPFGVNLRFSMDENIGPRVSKDVNLRVKCDRPLITWPSEHLLSLMSEGLSVEGPTFTVYPAGQDVVLKLTNNSDKQVSLTRGAAVLCAAVLDASDLEIVEN